MEEEGRHLGHADLPTAPWKALARAWRWQWMLDEGFYTSVSEIAEAEGIAKSYISEPGGAARASRL